MSALPPDHLRAMRETARQATRPVASLARRWEDLHEQAVELAKLAGLAPEAPVADRIAFALMLEAASDWQRELTWQAIEDIDAMMQPGLAALRTITARGQDALAPAQALWREFHAAREAVLGVLDQGVRQTA